MGSIYEDAEYETRFQPAYFLIYDNSTEDRCNRLIRVQPFNWLIWAINDDVYIIETTSATICPLGTTAAVQVTPNIYSMNAICLNVQFNSILNLYNDPIKIPYDLTDSSESGKFTILDALNILFREYLTVKFTTVENKLANNIQLISQCEPIKRTPLLPIYKKITPIKESELFKRIIESIHI